MSEYDIYLNDNGTPVKPKIDSRVQYLEGRVADVRLYGAKGDGVTDDTEAINAALRSGKSVVFFPEGTYLVSHYLRVASNTRIVGDHAHLKGTGTDKYCFFADGDKNFSIEGFEMSYFRRCFDIRDGENVVIKDIYAHDMYRNDAIFEDNYFCQLMRTCYAIVSGVRYENPNTNGDCVRVKDSGEHITIRDVSGYCGDFFMVLVPDESDAATSIKNVRIENVHTDANNYGGLQIEIRRDDTFLDGIFITGCTFRASGKCAPVQIANSTSGYYDSSNGKGNIQNLNFSDCAFSTENGNDGVRPIMRFQGVHLTRATFSNCKALLKSELVSQLGLFEFGNADYARIQFSNCIAQSNIATNAFHLIQLQNSARMQEWNIQSCINSARSISGVNNYIADILCDVDLTMEGCIGRNCEAAVHLGAVSGKLALANTLYTSRGVISDAGCTATISGSGNQTYTDVLGASGRVMDGMAASETPQSARVGDTFKVNNSAQMRIYNGTEWRGFATSKAAFRWAVFGDSFTAKNAYSSKFYHEYIKERWGCTVDNYAHSGSGYSVAGSGVPFYTRVNQISVATPCDVITIFGSLNDINTGGLPLGNTSDTDTSTICGCIHSTLNNLTSRYTRNGIVPVIGVISPTPWMSRGPSNASAEAYCEALELMCRTRGIPYLDLFHGSGLRPDVAQYRELVYANDESGVHPNEIGHRIIADKIEPFLLSLV